MSGGGAQEPLSSAAIEDRFLRNAALAFLAGARKAFDGPLDLKPIRW